MEKELESEVPPPLYLPDGDLVVTAAQKAEEHKIQFYRVYRTFLSCHSPIFRDMLAIGQESANEMHDGVPMVHFPDDAEDVAGFLSALHNPA